jgi:hypothetical protein
MRALAIAGLLIAVSGCSSLKSTPAGAGSGAPAPAAPPTAAPPPVTPPPVTPAPVTPPPAAPPPVAAAPATAAKSSVTARPPKQPGAAAAQSPATRPPTAPAAAAPPAAAPPAPAPPPAAAAPTLNLADLEQRLRETHAIGVFTKLSLKNQVDDLLKAFRALYRDPNKRPSAELRQRYDGLLLKVLSLLQDGDPPLATAIASSREAIWSILADPEKFAEMDT